MTTTTLPRHLISRIDSGISTGVLPTNEPCSPLRALLVVSSLRETYLTAEDVAEWINENRIAGTHTDALAPRTASSILGPSVDLDDDPDAMARFLTV